MGHYIENGTIITTTSDVELTHTEQQVDGYEQFVAAKRVVIEEGIPAFTDYGQEFINVIPPMINNGSPNGEVYSSTGLETKVEAYKAFSRDPSTMLRWSSKSGWLKYDAQDTIFIARYVLTTPYSGDANALPKSWKVLGSADDRNWVVIDSRYNKTLDLGTRYAFECIAPHGYRYIKIEWSDTRGNVGYSLFSTIDFYGVVRLAFDFDFDATEPVGMLHTEHQEELTHFPSVYKFPKLDDIDPFGDASQLCYYKLDGDLNDSITGVPLNTYSITPSYVEADDGSKALNLAGVNSYYSSYLSTPDKLPLNNLEGVTVCAWVKQTFFDYDFYQCIWTITTNRTCSTSDNCRIQSLWFKDHDSTVLHGSVMSNGVDISCDTPRHSGSTEEWMFLVVRQTVSGFEVLIDGKIQAGRETYATASIIKDGYLNISAYRQYANFYIKDVRVFNKYLDDSQLARIQFEGRTVARLRGNRMPKAFTLFDNSHKINGKELPLNITSFEVLKERKKFRFIDYRMTDGNSINSNIAIVEVQALADDFTDISNGSPVLVDRSGNGHKDYITDGDIDANHYYSANASSAYVRIDLGEPKDIRYIQNWNYYGDGRYYKNVRVALTNTPSRSYTTADYYITHATEYHGVYTETSAGHITSNLAYNYIFKVTFEVEDVVYPPEYTKTVVLRYPRAGSRLYNIFFEVQRNLWHIKPRLSKSIKESMQVFDTGNMVFPRRKIVVDAIAIDDMPKEYYPPFKGTTDFSDIADNVSYKKVIGTAKSTVEQDSLFEFTSHIIAGSGQYNTIVKVINENCKPTDHSSKDIRYNLCGEDTGRKFPPMEYVYTSEVVFITFGRYHNAPTDKEEIEENITNIVVVGTVAPTDVENSDVEENIVHIIS